MPKITEKIIYNLILYTILTLSLSSCVENAHKTGYTFDSKSLVGLKQGESDTKDVARVLGSPSAKSDFGDDTWYYIQTEYKNIAFFKPKIKSQIVIAVNFNKEGKLESIKKYTEDHARKVLYSKGTTPTEGHDMGVVEQLLGNVGRFSTERSN